MPDFNLPLFPFDSTSITVTTTVWIGVVIAVFFNLRLGWTLSALVVPGYLVPLMIARPMSAGVIFGEAVITYLIARVLSDSGRLHPWWSSVFGRDRFFVIVVVSVVVRAVCDGWLLPWAGRIAVESFSVNIDFRNDLHSFGLIVVALIANYFWKPGLKRGILPITVCTFITYAIVAWLLVGFTNFNTGNFHVLYEDISVSLTASPKAYIILLTTAWLASWINLRYAWDFNGILIPALLGLLWHDPSKILVSLAESILILVIATRVLQWAVFRSVAMQGGRKLVFFFTICFLSRLFASHVVPFFFPGFAVTDAFGMGYLLSTLIAMKAHDKKLLVRMVTGAIQVSVTGAVAGSLIGFMFFAGPAIYFGFPVSSVAVQTSIRSAEPVVYSDQPVMDLVRSGKILLYQMRESNSYRPPSASWMSAFRSLLGQLNDVDIQDHHALETIGVGLKALNFQLYRTPNDFLVLKELQPARGWGMYVINPAREEGLCLEVPAPVDEWATVESAVCLLQRFDAKCLGVSGTPLRTNRDGSSDVTRTRNSMFAVFHETFGSRQTVQVRGLTPATAEKLDSIRASDEPRLTAKTSRMWVRGAFPESLDLAKLKELAGGFEIFWNDSPMANHLRTGPRFCEIFLSRNARRGLVARTVVQSDGSNPADVEVNCERVSLRTWLNECKESLLVAGSGTFVPGATEEMLYMDEEVVTPLIGLLGSLPPQAACDPETGKPAWMDSETMRHLRVIDESARVVGYNLIVIVDPRSGDQYLALRERHDEKHQIKGWGTYVFRPGLVEEYAVEIPRPLFENRSFDFGIGLFEQPRASALLIAGAHPHANADGTSDISRAANRTNMFNLVRHVLFRQLGSRPYLIAQARSIQSPVNADIVVASDDGVIEKHELSPLKQSLLDGLVADRLSLAFVDGSFDTAGYELGLLMQAAAIQVSQNKEVLSLWLSPSLRSRYRRQSETDNLSAQFRACGIPAMEGSLVEFVTARDTDSSRPLPDELRDALGGYAENLDMLQLYELTRVCRGWCLTRILDEGSGQVFVTIGDSPDHVSAIINLTGWVDSGSISLNSAGPREMEEFIRSRQLWMEMME